MGTELLAIKRERLILPTIHWLEEVHKEGRFLKDFGISLKSVLESTVRATCHLMGSGPHYRVLEHDYHNWLTQTLMSLDSPARQHVDSDVIALYVDVSTFFYHELVELFTQWRLTKHQIRYLSIEGWVGDDLIVGMVY